ncbi:hypothetical protein HDU76_003549 [Blyttiomyces sp. JEL0837]|nr:hypothetical protein HDU76_003549 [Blyttiomyces sp. JEL0837]
MHSSTLLIFLTSSLIITHGISTPTPPPPHPQKISQAQVNPNQVTKAQEATDPGSETGPEEPSTPAPVPAPAPASMSPLPPLGSTLPNTPTDMLHPYSGPAPGLGAGLPPAYPMVPGGGGVTPFTGHADVPPFAGLPPPQPAGTMNTVFGQPMVPGGLHNVGDLNMGPGTGGLPDQGHLLNNNPPMMGAGPGYPGFLRGGVNGPFMNLPPGGPGPLNMAPNVLGGGGFGPFVVGGVGGGRFMGMGGVGGPGHLAGGV